MLRPKQMPNLSATLWKMSVFGYTPKQTKYLLTHGNKGIHPDILKSTLIFAILLTCSKTKMKEAEIHAIESFVEGFRYYVYTWQDQGDKVGMARAVDKAFLFRNEAVKWAEEHGYKIAENT